MTTKTITGREVLEAMRKNGFKVAKNGGFFEKAYEHIIMQKPEKKPRSSFMSLSSRLAFGVKLRSI